MVRLTPRGSDKHTKAYSPEIEDKIGRLGKWLSTTSRVQIAAPTGVGKTMTVIAACMAISSGRDFVHWSGSGRQRNVLIIDGEMPRRLVKERLRDEVKRLGDMPPGFHMLSHEDVENFAPLNTTAGQVIVEETLRRIEADTGEPVSFIAFDNIMSLIGGSMKDEEPWGQALPWIRSLTKRNIGQGWVAAHGARREPRLWHQDPRMADGHLPIMKRLEEPGIDINLELTFHKAREKTPATREDFEDVVISLVGNAWTHRRLGKARKAPSAAAMSCLRVLQDMLMAPTHRIGTQAAVAYGAWRDECYSRRMLTGTTEHSRRTQFSKCSAELTQADKITCRDELVWIPEA